MEQQAPSDHGTVEVPLAGGRANAGKVVRIGDQVARPAHPQVDHVEHFLDFLRANEVAVAPAPLPRDPQGRQRLTWIPGEAPTSPYPAWAFDLELLRDVAEQQRILHQVARAYTPPSDAVWATNAGNYFPPGSTGNLMCHNDLCMSNVIVDPATRRLQGFVDWDYVAPVDRLFDIAVLARHWVPFGDPNAAAAIDLDRPTRFALIADIHELTETERHRLVDLAATFLEQARHNIRALADGGNVGFQRMIADGYEAENAATVDWLHANRSVLATGR